MIMRCDGARRRALIARTGACLAMGRLRRLRHRHRSRIPTDLPVGLIFRIRVKRLREKYFAFSEAKIRCMVRPVPHPSEGRIAIVTDVGCGMRWTLWLRATSAAQGGRQSRVVPTPRRWCQVLWEAIPQGDGG